MNRNQISGIINVRRFVLFTLIVFAGYLMMSCGKDTNLQSNSADKELFTKISAYKGTTIEDDDNIDKIVEMLPGNEYVKSQEKIAYKNEKSLLINYTIDAEAWNPSKNDLMKNAAYMFMTVDDIDGLRIVLSEEGEENQSFLFVRDEYEASLGKLTEYDDFDEWEGKVLAYVEGYSMKTAEEFLRRFITLGNYDLYVSSVPEIKIDENEISVIGEERLTKEMLDETVNDYQLWTRLCKSFAEYFTESGMDTFIKNHTTHIYTRYIDKVNGEGEGPFNFSNQIITQDVVMTISEETEYDDSIMNVYSYTGAYVLPDGGKVEFEGRYHMTTFKRKWPKLGIRKYETDLIDQFKQ